MDDGSIERLFVVELMKNKGIMEGEVVLLIFISLVYLFNVN